MRQHLGRNYILSATDRSAMRQHLGRNYILSATDRSAIRGDNQAKSIADQFRGINGTFPQQCYTEMCIDNILNVTLMTSK